jgi:hypothetical protein
MAAVGLGGHRHKKLAYQLSISINGDERGLEIKILSLRIARIAALLNRLLCDVMLVWGKWACSESG